MDIEMKARITFCVGPYVYTLYTNDEGENFRLERLRSQTLKEWEEENEKTKIDS